MSFIKITEQNSLYNDLERKSVRDLLEDINTEDQKVALAVRETIPKIEELVLQIVPRMKQGGRIFYLGAGTSGRLGVLDASEIPPTFGMPSTLIVGLTEILSCIRCKEMSWRLRASSVRSGFQSACQRCFISEIFTVGVYYPVDMPLICQFVHVR